MLPGRPPTWLPVLATLVAAAIAQAPPGVVPPANVDVLDAAPAAGGPAELRWRLGVEALAAGNGAGAVPHLLAALEFHPDSPALLFDLARACAEPAARALWLERAVRASADSQGRLKLDAAIRRQFAAADLTAAQQLAPLRAQAAAELARAAERLKPAGSGTLGNGVTARWLCAAFVDLCGDSPALLRAHAETFAHALAPFVVDHDAVCKALQQVASGRPPPGTAAGDDPKQSEDAERRRRAALALDAARILAGLVRQAGYGKDVQGAPPPDLSAYAPPPAAAPAAGLPPPRVWAIDELQALDPAQREAFTLAHRDWADPGVALSSTGRYRLETVCGFETLLAGATTVEHHHERLAGHYGKDPFRDRQGTVRIVPEAHELETEGAPFWWAQGFQGGDRTVIRFAWGNVPGMGRLLTHELTHRFDGTLRPFLKPWYAEGHASWTGGHYARIPDREFVDDHLDVGACAQTFGQGYADADNLRKLLTGDLEDYRDNYFAGYALYAFLRGYPPKAEPKYRSALARYEQNARAGQSDPVGYFTATFCDGKEDRARGFDEFVAEWRLFLGGCAAWLDERTRGPENAWVGRYGHVGESEHATLVLDEPTWTWSRTRAEPYFGQAHAGRAGAVLETAGLPEPAALAYLWSLAVDGWQEQCAAAAVRLLHELGRGDAAAALQQLAGERFPGTFRAAGDGVPVKLPRTRAYLDALLQTANSQRAAGRAVAADALLGERQRLLLRLGQQAGDEPALPPPPVPRAASGFGFAEDSLLGFDDRRVPGLWYATPEGDLHVGRERPREGTGGLDRQSHVRDAFVRTVDWLPPGDHVVRAKIHFTTAFVQGALVLGHWRRDRGIRLHFAAGDYDYATGRREQHDEFRSVRLWLTGQWERDGQLPQTAPAWTLDFEQPSSWVDLELRVRGPSVLVKANGEVLFRYTTHDGSPIEGHLGFATSQGAIRVQQPTIQRLDLAEAGQARTAVLAVGLDVARQPTATLDDLLHLPTAGLPREPLGTLVLWLPARSDAEDPALHLPRALPALAKLLKDTVEFPQPWLLAVPAGSAAPLVAGVQQQLAEFRPAPMPVLEHAVGEPFTGNPWVLFVDAAGVLRAASEVGDPKLHSRVYKWARMFRARAPAGER